MTKTEEEEAKTPTTSTDIRTAVETAGSADESVNDDDDEQEDLDESEAEDSKAGDKSDKGGEDEEEDDSGKTDEEESDESTEDDKSKSDKKSEYRFTQFAGDGKPESYISNLEKAYENSSAEGINLNQKLGEVTRRFEAIKQAVNADPDLAAKLKDALTGETSTATGKTDATATDDPFLVDAKTKWEETSTKEAEAFIAANPEVVSDPKLNAEVKKWMEVFSREEYNNNGKLMTAGEAMAKAYTYLGLEDKRETKKSLSGAKKAVATTRPQGSRKPAKTGSDFTDSQLNFAANMGVSKEKLDKFGK